MPKIIIAGNWKMNKTITPALELAVGLKRNLAEINQVEIVICPPFTALDQVSEVISQSNIKLGAQNIHFEDEGAFTGEIAAPMLKDFECTYVIVGHSERRQYFAETDETINKKIKAALKHGFTPIVCVGESLDERKQNKTFAVIEKQIQGCFKGFSADEMALCVVAYEPVWAIGTGLTATPQQAQEVHAFIRQLLTKLSNKETADNMTIQYGGSVKPDNMADLIKQKDIDGALVGGASLKIDSFTAIVKNACVKK